MDDGIYKANFLPALHTNALNKNPETAETAAETAESVPIPGHGRIAGRESVPAATVSIGHREDSRRQTGTILCLKAPQFHPR